jgi:hypothetical protein
MSTLDEITKEKQRIGEALAQVDAQREKLTGQVDELEAAERVLARYSKGPPSRKTATAKTPTAATKAAAAPRPRHRRTRAEQSAGGKRASPTLSDQVLALANGKTQRNRRCVQGSSPEPCRRRDRPLQAGWPHRRARRETLRHAGDGDEAAHRSVKAE